MCRVDGLVQEKRVDMEIPNLIPVNSSNIDVVGYDAASQELFIGFKGQSGKMWKYRDVPEIVFNNMMKAKSIGSYYASLIKPVYTGEALHNIDGLWKMLK